MPPADLAPISTRFFPATRLGLVVGALVGAAGFLWLKTTAVVPPPPAVVVDPAPMAVAPDPLAGPPRPPPPPSSRVLSGPGGIPVPVPLRGPLVAHVWLEGCADCMPAFTAMRDGARDALLQFPVVNVAYGRASPQFASAWKVDDNLVFDSDGADVVRPFGISSFTTLVLDAEGRVVLRDRPDQDGYLARVATAFARAKNPGDVLRASGEVNFGGVAERVDPVLR